MSTYPGLESWSSCLDANEKPIDLGEFVDESIVPLELFDFGDPTDVWQNYNLGQKDSAIVLSPCSGSRLEINRDPLATRNSMNEFTEVDAANDLGRDICSNAPEARPIEQETSTWAPNPGLGRNSSDGPEHASLHDLNFSFSTTFSPQRHDLEAIVEPAHEFQSDDQRWHAAQSRSRAADIFFLYGVTTTKIFCRPSCASRRPSRRHIQFFPFPNAIEKATLAKFRACKRCIPNALGVNDPSVLSVMKVLRLIISETFGSSVAGCSGGSLELESLAKLAGLSTFHFHRSFKSATQVTPGDFISACRALTLQDIILDTHDVDLAFISASPAWTPRAARKALGNISPSQYAKGAPLTNVRISCVNTPSGSLNIFYSSDNRVDIMRVHAVVYDEAVKSARQHFALTQEGDREDDSRMRRSIGELERDCRDRDTQLDADVLSVLWRARVWLNLR